MSQRRKTVWAAVAVGVAVGCGGGGATSGGLDRDGGVIADDATTTDRRDTRDPGGRDLWGGEPDRAQGGEDVAGGEDAGETTEPCLGWFGCPCKKNENCQSGFCVDSPEGKVCTQFCGTAEECPEGWGCRQVLNAQGDPAWVCIPFGLYLCRPCRENSECASSIEVSENRCVTYAASGAFCGVKCGGEDDRPCPEGYSCQEVPIVGGGTSNQCVPDDGTCECNALAIEVNASTDCYIHNEWGTCTGSRQCLPTGLTACDAKIPAREECNGRDDDCDGETDPAGAAGCTTYYQDVDLDGFGMGVGKCLCEDPGAGYTTTSGDCNDVNDGVYPGVQEICNGMDDNCDGTTDDEGAPGCIEYWLDNDGDGYGVVGQSKCLCKPTPPYTGTQKQYDCDDTNKDIYPGATENCDALDNDCDGITDPENSIGCQPWYYDGDSDGFGSSSKFKCLCGAVGLYNTQKSGDCDDLDPMAHPLANEVCNGRDDNCNGQVDEGDPAVLCPPKPGVDLHGSVGCDGQCRILACDGAVMDPGGNYTPAWYDVNEDFHDGCECQAGMEEKDENDACNHAVSVGTMGDNGSKVLLGGNIVPKDDEDWYVVDARDLYWNAEPNACDLFNVKVLFTKNPGNTFVLDVYRGSCADANNICSGVLVAEWATNFYAGKKGGECGCSTSEHPQACPQPISYQECLQHQNNNPYRCQCSGIAAENKNFCSDNSAKFYFRVRRDKTKPPSCESYEIEVSNGLYPWSGQ